MEEKLMTGEEFKKFFDDVVNAALGTKGAPESLLEVLEKHGMSPDLPAPVADKLMPMLKTNILEIKRIPHNCSWCPACAMCAACGGLNAGSLGACAASTVHILD
jgi:hypothetical protein